MSNIYVHYGCSEFDLSKFKRVKNIVMGVKPSGGFWASPIDSTRYSWKSYCERMWSEGINIRKGSFDRCVKFKLSDDARVLHIRDVSDLEKADAKKGIFSWYVIDFESIEKKYDAIELHLSEDLRLYDAMEMWDCDSILIMNPDIICEI